MTTRKIRIKDGDNEALITTIKDYMKSDVVKVIKRHSGSNPGTNFRWYLEPEDEQHTVLLSTVDYIEASQSAKRMLNIQFARLYGNVEAISFPFSNLLNASADSSTQNRIALNVIQAVIDTCAAKIAKDQPKVEFITSGSEDYFLKLKARKLTKFIYGWFKKAGVYDLAESVFRDASITGTGFIKLYKEDNDIKTEFCPINTVLVDDLDGLNKTPRCMYQWSIKPKDLLIYKYPDHAKEIMSASAMLSGKIAANSTTEMVRIGYRTT